MWQLVTAVCVAFVGLLGAAECRGQLPSALDDEEDKPVIVAELSRAADGRAMSNVLLYSNGRAGEPGSSVRWGHSGDNLLIRWPIRGGATAIFDVLALSGDGRKFFGRNGNGSALTGRRVDKIFHAEGLPKSPALRDELADVSVLTGQWRLQIGRQALVCKFGPGGTASAEAAGPGGYWMLTPTTVKACWGKTWIELRRPLDADQSVGESWQGVAVTAKKIEAKEK